MNISYNGQLVLALVASAIWLFCVIVFAPGKSDEPRTEISVQMPMVSKGILYSRPVDRTHERMQGETTTEVIFYERKRP